MSAEPSESERPRGRRAHRAPDGLLLERGGELADLQDLADAAAAGVGGVAFIEGPAGIGKSRLLDEALARAEAAGCETAHARGSELERGYAFGVVRQLFEPRLNTVSTAERERLFEGAAGLAAPLLQDLDTEGLSPTADASHAVLHGLYWLTVNLATESPMALAVDDAHWADAPSLRFLAYLVNRIEELPVLLAVAARPFEPGAQIDLLDALASNRATLVVQPAELSAHAVEVVVRAALNSDVDPMFASACYEATRGNPLFLSELMVALKVEGIAPTAAQATRVLEAAPRSVARSVSRRLRQLAPQAAQLARAVAVLGDGSDPRAAASLAGLDLAAAATAAETLGRAGILDPGKLEFVHPVVRAAIYSELSAAQRASHHRAAAKILAGHRVDEDMVAVQLLAAETTGDGWAVEVLRRAARRARARGAPDVAVTYLERALAEPPLPEQRVDILVEVGLNDMAALSLSGGLVRTRHALELTQEPQARAQVALELGRALLGTGNFPEAADVLDEALIGLGVEDPELASKLEAQLLSASILVPSRLLGVLDPLFRLIEDSSQVSDPVLLAAMATVTTASIEPADVGADLAERALNGGRLSLENEPAIFAMALIALMMADRLDHALTLWDRGEAEARRLGSFLLDGLVRHLRAFVLVRRGDLNKVVADLGRAQETVYEDWRHSLTIPWLVPPNIDVRIERGELDEASHLLEDQELTGELPDIIQMNFVLESMGRLRVAQNRIDEGIAHIRECGRRLDSVGVRNPGLIPWRASLAAALAVGGGREEGRVVAQKAIDLARAFNVPRELGMGLRAAGLVEAGDGGIDLLREAVSVLAASPARLEHARALTDLGAALRREGHRSEAREPLAAGLDLAQRCGAIVLAERAHGELVATGARPRRLVRSGIDALTASERRVVDMAVDGLTNRQIAQALFVTEKTVEGHLAHAYRKLDVKTRAQLPTALNRGHTSGV